MKLKILKICEIDKNGRALVHPHSNEEMIEAIIELKELEDISSSKECIDCTHFEKDTSEFPCSECSNSFGNYWEKK